MKPVKLSLQAFLMSCLVAVWGLVYVDRIKWGVCVAALLYAGVILMGLCGLIATPVGLYVLLGFVFTVKLVSAITSAVLARRYNSNDSRFMGQVALEDVVGKVTGIWFSNERARIGTTFP